MATPIRFDEILLDPNVFTDERSGGSFVGWPEFANTVIRNPKTGVHKTNVNRYDPTEVLTVNMGLLTTAQRAYLLNIWRAGYGSGYGFRVRVIYDYTATLESFATGNGVATTFQLYKTYTRPGPAANMSGGVAHPDVRAIIKPVVQQTKETTGLQLYEPNGTTVRVHTSFKIYFGAVEQTSGWTVNAKTGLVTFSVAPPNGTVIKWSGEFDVPMTFMGNAIPFKHDVTSSEAQNVSFREILPAELGIVIS